MMNPPNLDKTKIKIENMEFKTKDTVFMTFEFGNLDGQIRISDEGIYIRSLQNSQKGDGSFEEFMKFVEASVKPVIMLDVDKPMLWHHLNHSRNYRPHNGEVAGTSLKFPNSLIKNK